MSVNDDQPIHHDIAQDIIEQSPSIAIRVTGENGIWRTQFITKNISQYGYNREDFINGRITWSDLVYPDDFEELCEQIDENTRSHIDRYTTIYRIVTAWGSTVWVNDITTVTRDENGEPLYFDCVVSDYTSLKSSLDKIEDNARQQDVLNDILASLHDSDMDQAFKIILDRTGKYLNISRVLLFKDNEAHTECEAIYEWCNEGISSVIEEDALILSYERDIPEIAASLRERGMMTVNYGEIPEYSTCEFNNEGVLSSAIFAIYLEDKPYGFICFDECVQPRSWRGTTLFFLESISKLVSTAVMRKQNADALRTSRATMEAVLDNIPTYIYVTNPHDEEIIFANRAYKRDFPITPGSSREETLHGKITEYFRSFLESSPATLRWKPQYFEVHLEKIQKWVGVQCNTIPWIDEQEMRLFSGQDITEKKQHEQYIQRIAYMDHLTGLPNRYRCDLDLQEAITSAQAAGTTGYVCFLDMDDFKIVNDGYGHDYGDALLIEFARFLSSVTLPKNQVFRFGGDEFVLLIDPVNAGYIDEIIDSLIKRARQPWPVLGKSFYCTISVGIVAFPDGDMGVNEIMKNADIAMYEAKRFGKNSFTYYSDSLRNDSIERAEMELLLRQCISNNFAGFITHYQPIVTTRGGDIVGAEALIRWYMPDNRIISPGEFISLAEYLGLIVPLGEFVLREAATFLKCINDSGFPDFTISVNVSLRQLQQQDIILQIEKILGETGVNPRNLIFEFTEGLAATNMQRILVICEELHKKGIHIAMDDFGTGYSSLSGLRDLPVDIIKIDQSFIQNITQDPYSHSFIQLITDFGHSVGKTICIEGVETPDQLTYCQEAGADTIQGYFFHRSMSPEAMLRVLDDHLSLP